MSAVFRCDPAMLDCLARPTLARRALPEWLRAAPRAAFSETRAPLDSVPGLGGRAHLRLFGRDRPMIGVVPSARRLAPRPLQVLALEALVPGTGEGAIVASAVASKLRALQGKARVSPIGA